ncbi:hypothetical protein Mapa_003427 [Marchantia paleacea]|nr:hypothetical protein Mapa_003427 [Marchantia paleacea]
MTKTTVDSPPNMYSAIFRGENQLACADERTEPEMVATAASKSPTSCSNFNALSA